MAGVALSRLGVAPRDFYELTPREFQYAIDDFDERQINSTKAIVEANQKTIWEAIRWLSWRAQNLMSLKGRPKKVNSPDQLGKFSWEKVKAQSVDTMKLIMYALAGKMPPK